MCAVSRVTDFYHSKPLDTWNWPMYIDYKKLVEEMKKYDAETGQPDCEKPEVVEKDKAIEQYLTEKEGPQP